MKTAIRIVTLVMLAALFLSACAPVATTPKTLTLTDSLGRTVNLPGIPQRIVIAGKASGLLVNAFFLFPGYDDRLVGYENRMQTSNDFTPLVSAAIADKTLLEVDAAAEQIAPLKPDLVILKTYMKEKLGDPIEQLGIPVVYLEMENPEQFTRDIRILGTLLGDSTRAENIVKYYTDIADTITGRTAPIDTTERPTTLLLQYTSKGGEVAFNIPPATWLQTQMVEMAGGNPIWKDAGTGSGWQIVTLEQIAAWNPDQIVIVDYKGSAPNVVADLQANSEWQALNAVQSGNLHAFPVDFYSWDQADPRWILGLTWLATILQPEKFSDLNVKDSTNVFYQRMYNLSEQDVTTKVMPLLEDDLK